MTTRVLPEEFKPGALPDVWASLTMFLATLKTGDVVENPYPDVTWPCDRRIEIPHNGVRFEWNGATIRQRTLRPFGQSRVDVSIVGGTHLLIAAGSPLIPASCNWGWVTGPGIPEGTHIVLDYNRRGGTLSNHCIDATGLPVVFTSQDDRSRSGFRVTGKDVQLHNVTTNGPELNPTFTQYLEAQHGVDSAGSTNLQLVKVGARHMHGDGIYPGAAGTRITTYLNAVGGTIDRCARSGISPVNCDHCTIDQYVIDHVTRTPVNIEPPNAGCYIDNLKVSRTIFGTHQLTLLSSGGHVGAHVGTVELSDCWLVNDDMNLRLVKGDNVHLRGPYLILRNRSTYKNGFGASFPTAALICIDHARPGSKVIDNKGFKLQPGRSPEMALVRARNAGVVEVHGNDHEGGIEVGPWV